MDLSETKRGAYIIGMTDCGEDVCAAGGRISTQSGTALEIFARSRDKEKNASLIRKVTRSGHTSTVEHIFFNIAFENVSVAVEQFMIEFRLASFTVKSRRYVDFSSSGYYVPASLSDSARQAYTAHMDKLFGLYAELCEAGIPKEDARFVLPYCFYSNFYCSVNGRELLHIICRMLYGEMSGLQELRQLGTQLLSQLNTLAPGIFASFQDRLIPKAPPKSELVFPSGEPEEKKPKPDCVLLSFTPDAQRVIAQSYLLGEGRYQEPDRLLENPENIKQILRAAVKSDRARCLESAAFTFRINNVSLSCITHFARHRMQSLSVPPLNTADRESYIIPDSVAENEELLNKYCHAFTSTKTLYDTLRSQGVNEADLVYCLLSGNTLDIVTTLNAKELRLFMSLRTCSRAQWEIRRYANEMLSLLRGCAPDLFSYYGPSCYTEGICPEGRLSCGKSARMKEIYG